ncbi:hypothetical protein Slin14017_G107230 [Septoria linicola]|nr:hypothetical protein Slin14017_G107230 [Septoria linicola]
MATATKTTSIDFPPPELEATPRYSMRELQDREPIAGVCSAAAAGFVDDELLAGPTTKRQVMTGVPVHVWQWLRGFKGYVSLAETVDDPLMGSWLKWLFARIMNSIWINSVAPDLELQWAKEHIHDMVATFKEQCRTKSPDHDFKTAEDDYPGAKPTLDNVHVYTGVMRWRKKPYTLRPWDTSEPLPVLPPNPYQPE